MSRLFHWLLVVVLFSIGCNKPADSTNNQSAEQAPAGTGSEKKTTSSETTDNSSQTGTTKSELPPLENIWPKPLAEPRQSLKGNWAVYLSLQGGELPLTLLKIEGTPLSATALDTPEEIGTLSVESSKISETTAGVVLTLPQSTQIDFQGDLKDGNVVGNVLFKLPGDIRCLPARLIPTEDSRFPEGLRPKTDPAVDLLQQAIEKYKADGSLESMKDFIKEHPESPLAIDAQRIVLSLIKEEKMATEEVEKQIAVYRELAKRWGPRREIYASLEVGSMLARMRYLPETTLNILDETEERLTDDLPGEWKDRLEFARKETRVTYAISRLSHQDEQERQKAVEKIREVQKSQPFHHRILFALADYAEKQKQFDEAMNWYARLTVIPSLQEILYAEWDAEDFEHPLPQDAVTELWEKKHGNTDGLEAYLEQVYVESIYGFLPENPVPPVSEPGTQAVLCELFTGAMCPPCVAADVATGAVQKTYPPSQVIVLRYHQHIPGPDQLTNQDSEARSGYYQIPGTPIVFLNGKIYPNVQGSILEAEQVFGGLREAIDPLLKENSKISLKLTATADGESMNVAAEVDGLENSAENLSLRLVLAEEEISFPARNGIRKHEMIVRAMPGGFRGIKPKDGKLQYSETIQAREFKQRLQDYLAAFEEGRSWSFPVKPLELKDLHLVAFVQDDSTREVLQTAAIPVSGKLNYPQDEKPAKTEPKKDAEKSGEPIEAPRPGN